MTKSKTGETSWHRRCFYGLRWNQVQTLGLHWCLCKVFIWLVSSFRMKNLELTWTLESSGWCCWLGLSARGGRLCSGIRWQIYSQILCCWQSSERCSSIPELDWFFCPPEEPGRTQRSRPWRGYLWLSQSIGTISVSGSSGLRRPQTGREPCNVE